MLEQALEAFPILAYKTESEEACSQRLQKNKFS